MFSAFGEYSTTNAVLLSLINAWPTNLDLSRTIEPITREKRAFISHATRYQVTEKLSVRKIPLSCICIPVWAVSIPCQQTESFSSPNCFKMNPLPSSGIRSYDTEPLPHIPGLRFPHPRPAPLLAHISTLGGSGDAWA